MKEFQANRSSVTNDFVSLHHFNDKKPRLSDFPKSIKDIRKIVQYQRISKVLLEKTTVVILESLPQSVLPLIMFIYKS